MKNRDQAKRLFKLGIAQAVAARDLREAKSVVSRYLKDGRLSRRLAGAGFVERLDRYIEKRSGARSESGAVGFTAPSLVGRFSNLGLSLEAMAKEIGVEFLALKFGVYHGKWRDEATYRRINQWIEERSKAKREGKPMLTKISLREEVLEFFALKRDPFTNEMESEADIFETREAARAEKVIMGTVDRPSWIAVTGPVGSGKSTMLKRIDVKLAKRPDVVLIKPRIIEKQHLGAGHVVDAILQDLGVEMLSRRSLEHKARLVGRALEEAHRDGKKVVLLIDESHLLRTDALLALKRLYEFEVGFRKLISIVLVGQPGLARTLRSNFELAEVSQRVDLVELGILNGTTGKYLQHKLERAGAGNRDLFDGGAIRAIRERVETPLGVNNVAAASMLRAWDAGEKRVTAEIVRSL